MSVYILFFGLFHILVFTLFIDNIATCKLQIFIIMCANKNL